MRLKAFHLFRSSNLFLSQLVFALTFAVTLLSPNLSANWGLVDDHEIMSFLGSDFSLPLYEIPEKLSKTEAGFNLGAGRYRPVYYLVRLVETSAWGGNPNHWYLFRVMMFGSCFFITLHLLCRSFGILFGGLSSILLFSNAYWADIWARLGPAEAYCAVGLAFYSFAFVKLWDGKERKLDYLWWGVLALSAALAMGSKENFLLLLPASAVLLLHSRKEKRLNWFSLAANILLFGFGLFITAVVVIALRNKGADVYSNPVTPVSRLLILKDGILSVDQWRAQLPFVISLSLFVASLILQRFSRSKEAAMELIKETKYLFFVQLVLITLWYSQYVFYNGNFPNPYNPRYDFPGVLCRDLAYIFLAFTPLRIFSNRKLFPEPSHQMPYFRTALVIIMSGWLLLSGLKGYATIYYTAKNNSIKTQEFTASFLQLVSEVKKKPETPVLMECNHGLDYERVFGLREFLSSYGVKNRLMVKVLRDRCERSCEHDLPLAIALRELSEKGEVDGYRIGGMCEISRPIRFYPLQIDYNRPSCFVVSFSGEPVTPGIKLGRIW